MEKVKPLFHPFSLVKFLLANFLMAIAILCIFVNGAFDSWQTFGVGILWAFLICASQWSGLTFINYLIDRKIKWIEKPVLRSLAGIASLVGYSVLAYAAIQFTMIYLVNGVVPADSWKSVLHSILFVLLISFFISLLFTAIGFFRAWKKALVSAEKLKAEMMAYKYESLRNQINPHFLFNSFNVLSDLVYADQAMAVKFIKQMSELFRYVLDSRDRELVPLSEELEFMQSFTYLLKTRFEGKLRISIELQPDPAEYIVPMTLQMLVENAVKHNEVSEPYPLSILIRKSGDYLEVENSLQLKNAGENSKGTGLNNIRQQFSFFTDREIEILPSKDKFKVRVPILKSAGI